MSLFSKLPHIILYIQPHSIDFVSLKGGQVLHLDIPTNLMDNLEIYDQIGFEKLIDTFIQENNLKKQEVAILLSESLVFEKRFPKEQAVTPEAIQQFIDKVPLKPSEISHKTIHLTDEALVIAVNHDIFNVLVNVLTKNQWTVKTVLPMQAAPSLLGSNQLSLPVLKNVLKSDKQIALYNLLQPVSGAVEESTGINKAWLVGAAILIITVIGFVLLESTGTIALPAVTIPGVILAQPSPTSTPVPVTPTTTPTPTVTVDKEAYKITVLNGSGIPGEARLLQDLLEDEEFVVANTGNANNSNFTKTVIVAKEDVPEVFINELKKIIEESYVLEDNLETLLEDSDDDIVITIGREKKE